MKRLVKIFLFAILFFGVERLCHKATDGFAIVNIYAPPGDNSKRHRAEMPDPKLLTQTYRYLNCGSQSYIFVSEDGKTILKFFKFQHMRIPPWLDFLPSKGKFGKNRLKKRKILEETFKKSKKHISTIILSGSNIELDRTSLGTMNSSTVKSLEKSEYDLIPFMKLIKKYDSEIPIGFINFKLTEDPKVYLKNTMERWVEMCNEVELYEN